jgi:hypothetical protein
MIDCLCVLFVGDDKAVLGVLIGNVELGKDLE